ncbi:hypothetical protein B0H19DRAFT_1383013 [Mycena capillaripes]|nr:hypothetical protein B0H19DRAFT_1383013 [Mycena capillaripes]
MLPPRLAVQELWDHIISFEHQPEDLKSFALVSRSFLAAAQSQLFHQIDLGCPESTQPLARTEDIRQMQLADKFSATACDRLQVILTQSPHLGRYIRAISTNVEINPYVLEQLVKMALPRLNKLTIRSIHILVVSEPMNEVIRKVSSLTSLQRLLIASGDPAPAFKNTVSAFNFFWFEFGPTEDNLDVSSPVNQRQIERLTINACSPLLMKWLQHPRCPLDFQHLVAVDLTPECATADMLGLVDGSRLTITDFAFTPTYADEDTFDLSNFPRITDLRVCSKSLRHFFQSTIPWLSRVKPHPTIKSLMLEFYTFSARFAEGMDWDHADEALAALPFPALQQFAVLLPERTPSDMEDFIEEVLSQMYARVPFSVHILDDD